MQEYRKIVIKFFLILSLSSAAYAQGKNSEQKVSNTVSSVSYKEIASPETQFSYRNEEAPFGRKFLRGMVLVQGVELIGLGVLVALPPSVTQWHDGYLASAKKNLKRAWTSPPVMDKDDWFLNYIGHPIVGAYYYNAVRSQGVSKFGSFLFSALQSTLWEYGLEAVAEQPSIQDLIITPIVGSIAGEGIHLLTLKMGRNGFTFGEKVLLFILNPMYIMNNGYRIKKPLPNF